jgi:GR25 family glycosyltransferase involved in LPS biosynthesis
MKHLEAWYDIAKRKLFLALILEDDPLFVPFFKEKLNRVIYTAIRTGALRISKTCFTRPVTSISNNEWIQQEPMLVIGACINMHDEKLFQISNRNAAPILSTQKSSPSRCAHAYLLTACSARELIEQISLDYIEVDTPDFLQNTLFNASTILQSFWLDPPLVYQGNRVDKDLDQIPTFKETKYNLPL